MVVPGPMGGNPLSAVWIRTLSGPVVRADRLASLSVLYGDGHHVDFDDPAAWRDESAELTAFFDHLEYGLLIATCHVRNALVSMHGFMDVYTGCLASGRAGVLGAVPGSDPVVWALDRFLPSLPMAPEPPPYSGPVAAESPYGSGPVPPVSGPMQPYPPSSPNGQGVPFHEQRST